MLILLLLVINLCVIQISNAQLDSSEKRKLDEESRIVFIDTTEEVERPYQLRQNIPMPPRTGCGLRNVGVIGMGSRTASISSNEDDAEFAEFPWTVIVMDDGIDKSICGGSLIHPKVVLTAYHNVATYGLQPADLKVRAGEWDMQSTTERLPHQERKISRIIGHPDYSAKLSHIYDIALIELIDQFALDFHIGTVCLPPANFVPNQPNCFASGWGKGTTNDAVTKRNILKKVPLGIAESNKCEQALQSTRLGESFQLDSTFICAGGVDGIDTCQGDGGSPLVCPDPNQKANENRYIQNGIVSWGIGCKEANIPAVYTNVAILRQWIDETMRFIGLDINTYISPNKN